MNVKLIIPCLSLIIILYACESDLNQQGNTNTSFPGVESGLWPYFIAFEKEAKERGFDIDLVELGISGVIKSIDDLGVAGTCQYGNHIAHVTIDRSYWNNSSSLNREYVVFHELGHCALGRGHDESSYNNGICKSLMNSGLGHCIPAYNTQNRERYLDELFHESD